MDAKVINEARAFLRNFRSVLSFADMVDQIGTWEGALTEIKISAKDEQVKLDKLKEEVKEQQAELVAARASVAAMNRRVKDIEAAAQTKATEILKVADADAAAQRTTSGMALAAERQELAELRQEIGRLSAQKDAALVEMQETQKQHAALKERILNG